MKERIEEHQRVVSAAVAQIPLLEKICERLIRCFENGGRLCLCGNGGSAADAQHIAAELVGRFKRDHKPLPAMALTTDTSILTAVANDFDFERIFARQVEAQMEPNDVLWALSVSGTSPNVVAALRAARQIGAATIGFTGQNGAAMGELCDLCFVADHTGSDRVQEVHQLAYHLVCERLEQRFASG